MGSVSHFIPHARFHWIKNFWFIIFIVQKIWRKTQKGTGYRYPSLKIASRSALEVGVCISSYSAFHACIIKCTICPIFEVKGLHYYNLQNKRTGLT